MNALAVWFRETRADFLILSVFLVCIGGAAAYSDGVLNVARFFLTVAGVVAAHMSVNLYNEYSDWRTGIDDHTRRTPFSGGSGAIQEGIVKPSAVLWAARTSLLAAFLAGLYLARIAGWPVLVFMAFGGLVTVTYTDYLARWVLGEIASGLTLGSLVVLGAYYVQTSSVAPHILWVSIPPGLLTTLLLFLNEFPDMEADRSGGRYHLVIALGKKRAAAVYAVLVALVYAIVAAGIAAGVLPVSHLLACLTLPAAAVAVVKTFRHYEDHEAHIPALGMNVVMVLGTDLLLAVGYLLG